MSYEGEKTETEKWYRRWKEERANDGELGDEKKERVERKSEK